MHVTTTGNASKSAPPPFKAFKTPFAPFEFKSIAPPFVGSTPSQQSSVEKNPLTPREVQILGLIARGMSDWQIGALLLISHKTVNYHVERAKRKLQSRTRIQAAILAVQRGLVDGPSPSTTRDLSPRDCGSGEVLQ